MKFLSLDVGSVVGKGLVQHDSFGDGMVWPGLSLAMEVPEKERELHCCGSAQLLVEL